MLPKLLTLLFVVGTITRSSAQVVRSGHQCTKFEGTPSFNEDYITKLIDEERAYLYVKSSGPDETCQRLKFYKNGTVTYSYYDELGEHYSTGEFRAYPATSVNQPGEVRLSGLPQTVFIEELSRQKVVVADDDLLVLASCIHMNYISIETTSVLIDENKFLVDRDLAMKKANISTLRLPAGLRRPLKDLSQSCAQSRGSPLKIFDFLVKIGIFPDVPLLRNFLALILEGGELPTFPLLYSGINSAPFPTIPEFGFQPVQGYFVPFSPAQQPALLAPYVQAIVHPQAPVQQSFGFPSVPQQQQRHPGYPQVPLKNEFSFRQMDSNELAGQKVPQTFAYPREVQEGIQSQRSPPRFGTAGPQFQQKVDQPVLTAQQQPKISPWSNAFNNQQKYQTFAAI